jgi:hypothetical protein
VPQRDWTIHTVIGESLGSGSDNQKALSQRDYLLLMFPPYELATIMTLTSEQLLCLHKDPTHQGPHNTWRDSDALRITHIDHPICVFFPSISVVKYGSNKMSASSFLRPDCMSRHCSNSIWSAIWFSRQPNLQPQHMSLEAYRWLLVDGFVDAFNSYRETIFSRRILSALTNPSPAGMDKMFTG